MTQPTAIDMFSGAGGASLGIISAGYDLLLAVDVSDACARTHTANLSARFLAADIRHVEASQILDNTPLTPGDLDLLFAGPPCQGFSIIGPRQFTDERNSLFIEIMRVAGQLRPKCIVIENVPGLINLGAGAYLVNIMRSLRHLGYEPACAELLAAQYGVPQMRWRLVIIAWRRDLGIPAGYGFPKPSLGDQAIGGMLSNTRTSPVALSGFINTADAISDLPVIEAGQEVKTYSGKPRSSYQRAMRKYLEFELPNHYAANLSQINLARIALLKPGQDWRDLPFNMLTPGMQRAHRKDHTRRYRRMSWDGVPRAVITRFRDPKSGEYIHPEQDRTISIREAARLQSFPDWFCFQGSHTSQYEQVGNAVPPLLASAIASEIHDCLSGTPHGRLEDPFRLRPVPFINHHGELADP